MAALNYSATVLPADCAWSHLSAQTRARLCWGLWAVTWLGLAAGCFDTNYWRSVVGLSIGHALLVLALVGFRPLVFPAQLRLAYVAWVTLGTYLPQARWMMYVTLIGLAANLLVGWCPLARLLYLLPWNRTEPFELGLLARVFLSGPVPGRFQPPQRRVVAPS
jgi:hypothetical protein